MFRWISVMNPYWRWVGKTRQGVNRWELQGELPSWWTGLFLLSYSILAVCASISFLLYALLNPIWSAFVIGVAIFVLVHALGFGCCSLFLLRMQRFLGMSNLKQVSHFLNVGEGRVQGI